MKRVVGPVEEAALGREAVIWSKSEDPAEHRALAREKGYWIRSPTFIVPRSTSSTR